MSFKSKSEIETEYTKWLGEIKTKLGIQGHYYLGQKGPFPNNTEFKPKAAISNSIRSQVYQLHIKDSNYWSNLRLSSRFNINVARIESIIRQKAYEASLNIGEENKEFVRRMESHILMARQSVQVRDENIVIKEREPRPALVIVPENYSIKLQVFFN